MKLSGVISKVFEVEVHKEDFRKRNFVLNDTSGGSVEELQFELIHDGTKLIDPFSVGDEVTVYFTIKGRRWKDPSGNFKYFTTLRAWQIQEDAIEAGQKKRNTGAGDQDPGSKKRKTEEVIDA